MNLPTGCNFKDRCPDRMEICDVDPVLYPTAENHHTKCHLHYDHEQYAETGADGEPVQSERRAVGDGGRE